MRLNDQQGGGHSVPTRIAERDHHPPVRQDHEVVVVPTHLAGRATPAGNVEAVDGRRLFGQQARLDLRGQRKLPPELLFLSFGPDSPLEQGRGDERHHDGYAQGY
jgi:hypothetical protein